MEERTSDEGTPKLPRMNEKLQQAGAFVKAFQERFGDSVLDPGKQRGREFANSHPVSATFAAIFLGLAFVPIASYLAFVTFIFISSFFLCFAVVIGFTLFVGTWAGLFLFLTLLLILFAATVLTLGLFGFFLAYRLLHHIRSSDGGGVHAWAVETKDRIVSPEVQKYAEDAKRRAAEHYSALKDPGAKAESL